MAAPAPSGTAVESVTAPTPIAPAASLPDADVGPSAEAIQQTPPAQPPNSITDHHSIEYASCDTNSCDTSHLLADQQKPETDRVDDPPATPASLTENLKHEAAPVAQQQLPPQHERAEHGERERRGAGGAATRRGARVQEERQRAGVGEQAEEQGGGREDEGARGARRCGGGCGGGR